MPDFHYSGPVKPFMKAPAAYNTFTTLRDITPADLPIVNGGDIHGGSQLNLDARGVFSCTGTPTLQLGFAIETTAGAIVTNIALSLAITLPSGAALLSWEMWWKGMCHLVGTSGTLIGSGGVRLESSLTVWADPLPMPLTDVLRTVVYDTTIPRGLGIIAAFSASNVLNEIKVNGYQANLGN